VITIRSRQKITPFAGSDSKQAKPALWEGKATQSLGQTGFVLFLHGLKAGFACLQIQINPAKSRFLLFDERK
jgi:hypothetical protein